MLDGLAETLIVYGKIGGQGKYTYDNGGRGWSCEMSEKNIWVPLVHFHIPLHLVI